MEPDRTRQSPGAAASPAACVLCPRRCGADRRSGTGFCGMPDTLRVARAALHFWEEPCISGTRGSGTIFLSGCNLRCVFCQNRPISHEGKGRSVSEEELASLILRLQDEGAHNINLVTPTHYTDALARVLTSVRPRLAVPVVWNSGGYESVGALRLLEGLVDVYLPDFKYVSSSLSAACSGAPDYAERASEAVVEMYRQVGRVRLDRDGFLAKGLLIRHLVLPGFRKDSIAVLRRIADLLPVMDVLVSVMRQYTPEFLRDDCPFPSLRRRVTEFEYASVLDEADRLGLEGYRQGRGSATAAFTPDFFDRGPGDPQQG